MVFGEPNFGFWGRDFYGGNPPLFYSLYPGLLCLCLLALAARPKGWAKGWAWGMIGLGAFLALGFYHPLIRLSSGLAGTGALRYPIKVWLLVAVGASLLVGYGFERLQDDAGRKALLRLLAILGALYGSALALLTLGPPFVLAWIANLVGANADGERLRWATLCLLSLLILALIGLSLAILRRDPRLGGALLLAIHVATQIYLLDPLIDSDGVEHYVTPPPLLTQVPEDAIVVHGGGRSQFGSNSKRLVQQFPDLRTFWLTRQNYAELYGFAASQWGRHYALNFSPEGLDSFFTISLSKAMPRMDDTGKLRMLAASGVDLLILDRELQPAARSLAAPPERQRAGAQDLYLYRLNGQAPKVSLLGHVLHAPHLNATLSSLTSPDFDPRTSVVLPGDAPNIDNAGGKVEIQHESSETLDLHTDALEDAVLLIQRTYLPIYKASVDGQPAEISVANFHRIGIHVPAGQHEVRLWVDRRPFRLACWASLVALLGLALLVWRDRHTDNPGENVLSTASPA
jgi:hypothetical protein